MFMAISIKKQKEAYDILEKYDGNNKLLNSYKYFVFEKKTKTLNGFECDFILRSHSFKTEKINKTFGIARWYGEKQKEAWNVTFTPEKVYVYDIMGETENAFYVSLKYRKSAPAIACFLPKKAILGDLRATDYTKMELDFEPIENKLSEIGYVAYEHQKTAVKFLLERKKCVLADDQGLGKALSVNTLIYTPNGTKKIGDAKVGDEIIGSDGKTYNIKGVYPQGVKELYRVEFNDGFSTLCCEDHLWTVQSYNGTKRGNNKVDADRRNKFYTLSLKQMLDKDGIVETTGIGRNKNKKYKTSTYYKTPKTSLSKWQIPIVKPIEFENNEELPIDPYLMGISLGDGHLKKDCIYFTQHKDDFDEIFNGCNIVETKGDNRNGNIRKGHIKDVGEILKNLKLHDTRSFNKFIPNMYKYTSVDNRVALLQGLLDSDGYCMKNHKNERKIFTNIEYTTVSETLANDVIELVQCLGGIARVSTKIGKYKKNGIVHECRKSYRVSIKMPDGIIPFRLKRKSELYHSPTKYKVGRYIKNITPCGEGEAVCISVDSPDNLFVAEHAIVTHNTLSAIMASILGDFKKILIICPASLKTNWEKEISNLVPEDRIGIVNGDDWVDKQYTIINFDIIDRHHKMPTTVVKSEVVDKKGNVKIKETVVKSRKKDVIQKAIEESSMCKANFDLVIIDEVHKLSDNKSIRYKVIEDFIVKSGIKNIYLMSGTPMTNRPMNLYHVLNLIKHPVTANYEYYVRSFCEGKQITNRHTGRKVWLTNGASNLDELKEIIKDSYLRRLKNDIPDMVDKVIYQRYYKLTDEQKIEYDNLWDEYKQSQLELGKTNLNRDLTEAILLRQFISDAMVDNTIALTDEFIEDGEKVLIACCFNNEIAKLKEYYGDKAVIYKGGMTIKQKDKAEHDFMNDKKKQVFIGNIQAAGVGLTLTSASICIFNSYDWVPGNNLQMMDRVHRIGQKDDVKVFYQLFTQTISERMWNTVMRKALNIDAVIKDEDEK